MSWRQLAACRGLDPAIFFPDEHGSPNTAKAVCASCPVRVECFEYAVETGEKFGTWGGVGEGSRRRIRRSRGVRFQNGTGLRIDQGYPPASTDKSTGSAPTNPQAERLG